MNKHKHPYIYHKKRWHKNFFEGWYYKQVSKDGRHTISFIPGVNVSKGHENAFIQCLYLKDGHLEAFNIDYPFQEFKTQNKPFSVELSTNTFTLAGMCLDIKSQDLSIKGNLKWPCIHEIDTHWWMPNIMGFFSYIPFMECNHGVISMGHDLEGHLTIEGETIDFGGGRGYIEKDWGTSFPKDYVWLQSNHFDDPTTSLFCSVAHIPFMGFSFKGFICNLVHQGKEYRFATYKGSRIVQDKRHDNHLSLVMKNRGFSLSIEADCQMNHGLKAPKKGLMNQVIKEGLSGQVHMVLRHPKGQIILNTRSNQCGIEIVHALEQKK